MRQQPAPRLGHERRPSRGRSGRRTRRSRCVAPASSAARATATLVVSIERRAPGRRARAARSTGTTRRSSSSSATGSAPGRVDSPPTSRMSAPSAASRSPCSTAASASRNSPPSENESGVTFTTPMISTGRRRHALMTLYEFLLFIHISAAGLGRRGAVQPGCWRSSYDRDGDEPAISAFPGGPGAPRDEAVHHRLADRGSLRHRARDRERGLERSRYLWIVLGFGFAATFVTGTVHGSSRRASASARRWSARAAA